MLGSADYGRRAARDHIIRRFVTQQRGVSAHHRQEIVEIVGDASGQLSDGFELLSLAQGRLGLSMLGHLCAQADVGPVQLKPKP